MIFELLVQTPLIISHLTGKNIKLYVMGIIANLNLYWFNSFMIHLRRCFIKFNMIESKTEPKETNLINRIKSTVIEIQKVCFEWIWHEIITFLISLAKLSKLHKFKLHKNLKCVLWDKPVNHGLTWDGSYIPNVVKHSTSFYYEAVRYIKFNQNSHFTFLMNKIRSLSH